MNKLYDALENCLQKLEHGQDLDSVLKSYPDLAKQLRPMLEASLRARTSGGIAIPRDVQRRGRARLMQRAAEMREAKRAPRRRMIPMFSRWAITFGLAGALFLSSTGLVSASSGTLPGDQLYPVKRTWEDVRLLFMFNSQGRNVLESQYEQERLNEIDELLMKGRSVPIVFSGLVINQQNGQWMVSGIPVSVTNSTRLPASVILNGVPVTVIGTTRNDGTVDAQEVQLLQPGVSLPPLEPSGDNDQNGETDNENHATQVVPTLETHGVQVIPTIENLNSQATSEPTSVTTSSTPVPEQQSSSQQQKGYEFSGVVESMQGNMWNINGQSVIADQAQVKGEVKVGSAVKFEGYYDITGSFIVTKVEVKSVDGGSATGTSNGAKGSGNSGSSSGGNTNGSNSNVNNQNENNSNTNNQNENNPTPSANHNDNGN